jgi:hypothetical protein
MKTQELLESLRVKTYFEELTLEVDSIEDKTKKLQIEDVINQILALENISIYDKIEAIEELKQSTKDSITATIDPAVYSGYKGIQRFRDKSKDKSKSLPGDEILKRAGGSLATGIGGAIIGSPGGPAGALVGILAGRYAGHRLMRNRNAAKKFKKIDNS